MKMSDRRLCPSFIQCLTQFDSRVLRLLFTIHRDPIDPYAYAVC